MHVTVEDKRLDSDIVWTSQELLQKLRHYYANREILIPDNDFYGAIRTKHGLENAAHTMQRHLKLKSSVSYKLSHKVSWPGHCTIKNKTATITLPKQALTQPFAALANTAHLLVHISMHEHGIAHIDASENERLMDLASIYSGLGIIIVNGLHRGNWSARLLHSKQSSCLGSLTEDIYIQELKRRLPASNKTLLASVTVAWERQRLYGDASLTEKPRLIRDADAYHDRSLRQYLAGVAIAIAVVSFGALSMTRSPAYTDSTLRELKYTADSLHIAYINCAQRLERLQETVPDDFAGERRISAEQGACKSLENRYNTAVLHYNQYAASRD